MARIALSKPAAPDLSSCRNIANSPHEERKDKLNILGKNPRTFPLTPDKPGRYCSAASEISSFGGAQCIP
jgi:hypothetical protein